jgi:hypothetical protein
MAFATRCSLLITKCRLCQFYETPPVRLQYGFPNAEDLDFSRAFLKICDERANWVRIEHDSHT